MPTRRCGRLSVGVLTAMLATACGSKEVSKPESVSARVVTQLKVSDAAGTKLDEPANIVAVTAYLRPHTSFQRWEFGLDYENTGQRGRANCCVSLKLGDRAIDPKEMSTVESFRTEATTVMAEFAFVVPPSVTEAILIYRQAPTGFVMKILR